MNRIVHIGFGAFHRAHQAAYIQTLNELGAAQWRITGVTMRNRELRDALMADGLAYTLAQRRSDRLDLVRITAHDKVIVAQDAPEGSTPHSPTL